MSHSSDNDSNQPAAVATTLPESASPLETESTEADFTFAAGTVVNDNNNIAHDKNINNTVAYNVSSENAHDAENVQDVNQQHQPAEKRELKITYNDTRYNFRNFKLSILTPFFGSNEPEPILEAVKHVHPCQIFSREVHKCLERNNNNYLYCQTRVADLYRCLREYKM